MIGKYKVITLCRSIKYNKEFHRVEQKLTLEGNLVLTPVFFDDETKTNRFVFKRTFGPYLQIYEFMVKRKARYIFGTIHN